MYWEDIDMHRDLGENDLLYISFFIAAYSNVYYKV